MADHLTHRTRFSYDGQGNSSRTCLDCNVPLETIWRICPNCATPFDGTSIGATAEARILCSDCTQRMMEERRESEKRQRAARRIVKNLH